MPTNLSPETRAALRKQFHDALYFDAPPLSAQNIAPKILALLDALDAQEAANQWRPIDPAAPPAGIVWFWVRPKTAKESYTDTSGRPITCATEPRRHLGIYKSWSALEIATHWLPLPAPPAPDATTETP
jgi:hypothetical protein